MKHRCVGPIAMLLAGLSAGLRSAGIALCASLLLFGLVGCFAPILSTAVWAQDFRAFGAAPPSWVQFGKLVKYRFETWLMADEAVANRFRAYVVEHAGKENGPPQTIVVRAWLNPDGTVERVTFPPLPDADADEDLHTILKRGNIGEAPPPEMLQPLNLSFALNPKK
jgi:hypothetical protein